MHALIFVSLIDTSINSMLCRLNTFQERCKLMFNEFKVIFLSIVIEAFPFILIGSIVATYIELFVDEDSVKKFLPKNPFIQIVAAAFLGLIFPICECTVIPIARRLIKKSVPVSTAIVFMLATPIINPVPMLATYYAFGRSTDVMIHRVVLGFIIAVSVGLLHLHHKKEDVLIDPEDNKDSGHSISCCYQTNPESSEKITFISKMSMMITHTWKEFLGVSVYLVIGSVIAAIVTVAMPDKMVLYMQNNNVAGILSMQTLGYCLSLCSHADAFVAAGLAKKFTLYPILAFLIISPMIDIKNTIIMMGLFKKNFAISLIVKIFVLTFFVVYLFRSWSI